MSAREAMRPARLPVPDDLDLSAAAPDALRELLHELRTPLVALSAALELLDDSADAASVRAGVAHLAAVLARAEAFAAPSRPLECSAVPLADALGSCASLLAPLFAERFVELELRVEPVRVAADPAALARIVVNLLSNAVRFAPAHSQVLLAGFERDGLVVIEVCDHGPGVADELIGSLFTSPTESAAGWGIGLAISAKLASAMGGSLSYVDAGPGACFELTLRPAR